MKVICHAYLCKKVITEVKFIVSSNFIFLLVIKLECIFWFNVNCFQSLNKFYKFANCKVKK